MVQGCGSILLAVFWLLSALFGVFALMFYVMAFPLWVCVIVTLVLASISFFLLFYE